MDALLPEERLVDYGVFPVSGYINDRLSHVEWDIKEKFNRIKTGIESVRKAIPEGAVEAEPERLKHGSQQSLI